MNKIMNIGYIGNGKSANRYHIPFVLTRKDKMLVKMIYTLNRKEDIWPDVPGVEYTENLDELLNNKDLNVIFINTPSRFHYEYAKKVIEAGKNCVVEKPFTIKVSEAEELFNLAKSKGVIVEAYQNRRFDSDFLTTKKVIESGKLGDILEIESHYDYFRPEVPESVDHYSTDSSYVYNHACHTFDQVIDLMGIPDRVTYDVRQILGSGRMNDYFDVDMFYKNTKVSVKSSYFRINSRPKFIVYGKKGMFIKYSEDRQEEDLKHFYMPGNKDFGVDRPKEYGTITYIDDNGYHEEKVVSEVGDYARYYDALYETIINGKEPLVKPIETITLVKMLEEATKDLK